MPTPCYISVEGVTQGLITAAAFTEDSVGNIYQEGHEDQCLVQAVAHNVTVPRDPQSGQPSGQRVHQPMVITKIIDKASPLLFQALCSGERLPRVELKWYRTSTSGTQENYFSTVLDDAILVNISTLMPNCQDPAKAQFTHLEELSFAYRMITWNHDIAGTSGSDDWRAPISA